MGQIILREDFRMRYIKIGVPDDFDEATLDNPQLIDYTKDAGGTPVKLWEPPYINVLDYGFIGLIDFMGDDSTIVNSARVSYGKGTKKVNSDKGLIRYLMRHRHTTPFEMCDFMFHVKAPIFVFRQWHRHRTASINEYSGRYSVMEDHMYLPTHENSAIQSTTNRQGRDDNMLSQEDYTAIVSAAEQAFEDSFATYRYLLGSSDGGSDTPPDAINKRKLWVEDCALKASAVVRDRMHEKGEDLSDEDAKVLLEEKIKEYYAANELSILDADFPGLARELARIVLPLATYSQMYWKANLKNMLHFIGLRSDSHAQYEIRVYSDAMLELIKPFVPWAVEAFMDYQMDGAQLSKAEVETMKEMVTLLGELSDDDDNTKEWLTSTLRGKGASLREVDEFIAKVI